MAATLSQKGGRHFAQVQLYQNKRRREKWRLAPFDLSAVFPLDEKLKATAWFTKKKQKKHKNCKNHSLKWCHVRDFQLAQIVLVSNPPLSSKSDIFRYQKNR